MKISPVTAFFVLVAVQFAGCRPSEDQQSMPAAQAATSTEQSDAESSAKNVILGDMIEPFDPPSLAELEESVEWVDSPVLDPMARLREQKAKEPPLVSVPEALAMRNDSREANEKIYSALSILAPPKGRVVDWNATFNRGLIMDLRSMNPVLTNSIAESDVNSLMAFNIFGFDWNMIPFADSDFAVSWQTSADHLIDKVVLRDDLFWSDGKPITAHDVAFTFKLIMTSTVPIPALRTGRDEIRWVEAYDDRTVVYFHQEALSTNVWHVNFEVVPQHIYGESYADDPTLRSSDYHRRMERQPISGGPYEVVRWSRGQEIVLKRREDFYMHNGKQVRDKPYFERMRFRVIEDENTRLLALKSGDTEEGELEAGQWHTQASGEDFYHYNTKVSGPEWSYLYIGWNLDPHKVPYFTDVRVRKALAYALNYDELLNDLGYGLIDQCTGIFHADSWMYPKTPIEPYHQDLDKAEDLLDEAGWIDSDEDGIRDKEINGRRIPFEFTLLVANKPDRIAICNLFRESLDSIGVICNIAPLEAAVLMDRTYRKNYQAEVSGWSSGADPCTNENVFGTGEGRNSGSYSNPEVDRLFDAAKKEFDRDKQAEIYGKIQQLIFADQPYLFLYNKRSLYGFNKDIRGYRFSPRGPFRYSPGIESVWSP